MICPKCKTEFTPNAKETAKALGKLTSGAKAKAARANGKLGGRPRKSVKRKAE
jgi:hypothetical protein